MLLTNGNGGDLSVDVQHAVAVHVHQIVSSALLVVTEEVDGTDVLEEKPSSLLAGSFSS